ncbi:copper chaperone for superoxide dismutase-like [Octopus vulgaris]|uniref:Copper chaperone for superoxide dismutase-like n=2 Tax=Octopus TaxID=6643 RepID=A0AA36BIM9_OCTVU|nr:copper chaperone for superoxide dismutase [Octopus sinensis]CAI9734784.1 copper chaperone for superoxide dismutase-like [Octopus vulgaris]
MDFPSSTEYAVQMSCKSCVNAVKKTLEGVDGISSFDINLEEQRVVVKSVLLSSQIKELLEKSGKKVALQGYGSELTGKNLGAAVAAIDMGKSMVQGVIRLVQASPKTCVIEGTLDGLKPGVHRLSIHEYGDISNGCNSCGDIYGLKQKFDKDAPGNLDVIKAGETGRSDFRLVKDNLIISEIIGRSMVIHEGNDISFTGNPSDRVGCGVIARSAGLFQNVKKICACDGVNVWNEKVKPGNTAENELPNAKI